MRFLALLSLVGWIITTPAYSVAQGNQPPTSAITDGWGNLVNDGDSRAMIEGETITLDIQASDPDGDLLTVTVVMRDHVGVEITTGSYDPATGRWTWTAGQGDANLYTVTISVCDGELCVTTVVNLYVNALDDTPGPPTLSAPTDGLMVTSDSPTLTLDNSFAFTGPITYDLELYYWANPGSNPNVSPDQVIIGHPEDASGQTSWTPAPIPENTWVYWRARAWNGTGPWTYSRWTGFFSFFVNAVNDPPVAPVLTRPAEGVVVLTRSPELEANNTTDPEGDSIDLYFEVATDDTFTTFVQTSPAVPQISSSTFTSWVDPAVLLDWGRTYAARACAVDSQGAMSVCSNVNRFMVANAPMPPDISLQAPFSASACTDVVLDHCPGTIRVSNAVDPEANPITLDLEIYEFGDVPGVDVPVIQVLAFPQDTSGTGTDVPIDCSLLVEDGHYRVRAQATDGVWVSNSGNWAECDMWINTSNCAPGDANCASGAIAILSPISGTVFPGDTQAVTVTVQNPSDADAPIPGTSLSIALCASASASFADCDASPANWQLEPSVADPALTTDLLVTQLADGRLLGPDMRVHVQACGLDELGECGPADATDFLIEAGPLPTCADIRCSPTEVCDPAVLLCVPDGGHVDPPVGADGGTSEPTSGCCGGESAPGGSPALAGAALLGLLALASLRRRYGR